VVCSSVLLVALTLVGAAVPPSETLVPTTKVSPFTAGFPLQTRTVRDRSETCSNTPRGRASRW
jgi:hypothetical protein